MSPGVSKQITFGFNWLFSSYARKVKSIRYVHPLPYIEDPQERRGASKDRHKNRLESRMACHNLLVLLAGVAFLFKDQQITIANSFSGIWRFVNLSTSQNQLNEAALDRQKTMKEFKKN
ncbi:hypothetical protein GQX74_005311 [Glossina fuscipes]|nr:hypothetical protein GQX74_005311 [Glossina fuscipes]